MLNLSENPMGLRKLLVLTYVHLLFSGCGSQNPSDLSHLPDPINQGIAIIGDSLSTGAFSHPTMEYSAPLAAALLMGSEHLIPRLSELGASILERLRPYIHRDEYILNPPTRIFASSEELEEGGMSKKLETWAFNYTSSNHNNFDTPEYSWGYLVSRSLGATAKDIFFVAQDGNRVKDTKTQVARLLDRFPHELPGRIFMFWTGNDICAADLNRNPSAEDFDNYYNHLWSGIELMADHITKGRIVKLHILGYLEVSQLVNSEDILSKKIKPYGAWTRGVGVTGRSMTVNEFRSQPRKDGKSIHMLPHPANMCKGILQTRATDTERIKNIKLYAELFRNATQEVIAKANNQFQNKLLIQYVSSPSELKFGPADIANDGFHLSTWGQSYLAEAVLNEID